MDRYDSIIIGAGHNGLVCAAYLARAGQRVLVIEAADTAGGLGGAREFHPGFRTSVAHSVSHFSAKVSGDLQLDRHGFDATASSIRTIGLDADGKHVEWQADAITGVSERDAIAFGEYFTLLHRCAAVLKPFWLKTIPGIGGNSLRELMTFAHIGMKLRLTGRKNMEEFLRIASLPARDLMDEYFDSDLLKSLLSWDGVIGAKMAPRSPNSSILALLYRMSGESQGAHAIPAGGVPGLITALCSAAAAYGADIRCGTAVERILVDTSTAGLQANGVLLANGEKLHARNVISATDPQRTFLNLVGVEYLDIGFTNRIRRLRCDGYVAKLHLALDGQPEFPGLKQPDSRMIIAPNMDAIEFAFDAAKYGELPQNPVVELVLPSMHDASLAANGQHVLSAHVMYVPYRLKEGWNNAAREEMCENAINTIAKYAPGIRQHIIHQEFLTPADLENDYRVTGGHWHHTEFALDQMLMMRPTYGAAQYRTPVPGLYMCGAGTHPGGDITGNGGHNAAHEILQ